MMVINDIYEKINLDYQDYLETLKEISYDSSNDKYICESDIKAYNYDKIIKKFYLGNNLPMTPDAILINDKINFIEFKNGELPKGEAQLNLRLKALEGIYNFFFKLIKTDMSDKYVDKLKYIVVYNAEKNYKNVTKKHISQRANKPIIQFGLSRFVGTYFSEVLTLTQDEFSMECSKWHQNFEHYKGAN